MEAELCDAVVPGQLLPQVHLTHGGWASPLLPETECGHGRTVPTHLVPRRCSPSCWGSLAPFHPWEVFIRCSGWLGLREVPCRGAHKGLRLPEK